MLDSACWSSGFSGCSSVNDSIFPFEYEFLLKEDTDTFAADYGRAGLYANGLMITKPLIRMMNAGHWAGSSSVYDFGFDSTELMQYYFSTGICNLYVYGNRRCPDPNGCETIGGYRIRN